ncbi:MULTISPECIES: sporulation protein YqfC [Clostridium]|uniref:YabP family protein n=4 Tax=Clostridium TaxID=1485 RepID=D8GP28_CLOLD|nr:MULTISPECIES: sporulation protein YqfC [Clostridium]ADK13874.1 conserved hypothetical protein [Clostridium ljungdahlii DSM 13528]AGY77105.1 sporulation protein YqfC [Clostridium autoethanogenum DSM 10061]ALU37247.1 Sporulation protein YqfC [Clostridium autoethanogenum DSM 10061]OAA87363.1 YabP family protein [Clostridium ljungdahlii DSM 13528]OAA92488.1 YabP family protein [Clostridium coskatii]
MGDKIYNAKRNIADKLELPGDIILNMPQIKITGDNEIIIENHRGIIAFDESQIKVNSGIGLISIYGSRFEVLFMGGSTITIGGRFTSIVYEGNK